MSNGRRPDDLVSSDVIDNALKKVRITSGPSSVTPAKRVGSVEQPIPVRTGSLTEMAEGQREQVEEERRDSVVTQVKEPDLVAYPPLVEEEEPVPGSDVSLLDKTPQEIQEEVQTVEEPRNDGAFAWYPKFHASVDKGQADEISPAVITAIVQARSAGDEEYIYGDAYGLFGMGASERAYVQQVLRETGELEPDEVMSVKEYNDWRGEPDNQINFYAPMIHGFVLRGVEAGIKGRDLAEMVGKQVELPGSRVLPDGAYAKGYDTVTATAQQRVNEEFPDGVPDKVRVEAGVLSQDALREAGLKVPTRQVGLFESEYPEDVTPRMVTTAEGEPFEAGRSREWYEKYLIDPISRAFRPVKQWAGLMYNSSPQGKASVELGAAAADRLGALVVTSITAASGSVGAPFYAVAGFAKTDTSKSDSLWHSLGMKSAGAFEAVKRRWERVGDHWAPQFVNKEEDQSGWEWTVEKWNELKDHVPDEGSGQDWFQTESIPLGWKEFKRAFIPGTQGWSEEKLDEEWNKSRDWSYTFMFDPDAERAYLKDKAQVLAEVNARRAMDGLGPRSLSYHETDELKLRHEDPSIEMVGEVVGDLTWLFPGKLIKGVGSLLSESFVAKGIKTQALKIPAIRLLVTEHIGSTANKLAGRATTPVEDILYAYRKLAEDLLPDLEPGEALKKFNDAQGQLFDPNTFTSTYSDSGGVVEALELLLRKGKIVDPLTNVTIDLTGDEIPELVSKLWLRLGSRPDMPTWTSVPHKSGWFSRPKLNLIARNTEKVLGPRATALGRSVQKRLETVYKIYKYNDNFWDHTSEIARDPAEGFIKVLRDLTEQAQSQMGDAWGGLDDIGKQDEILNLFKKDVSKEFKMKHGFAQGGKIYDTLEASDTYRQLIDAETINPFLMAGPRFFRGLWIESNLSARPGFTARNVIDSTFRALTFGGGGIFRRSLKKIMADTPLVDEILAGLQRGAGTGASAAILQKYGRLPRFWSPKDWWTAIREVTEAAQKEGASPGAIAKLPWPAGRWGWGSKWRGTWKTPWGDMNLTYSTMVDVMRDWNEAFEVMLRIRLFDKFYHNLFDDIFKWWRKGVLNNPNLSRASRQKLKEMLDNLPDKEEDVAIVVAHFLESTGADLSNALIPKEVTALIDNMDVADPLNIRSAKQIVREIADDLYSAYKKNKKLDQADVDEIFSKRLEELHKNFDDALDDAKATNMPKDSDDDVSGFISDDPKGPKDPKDPKDDLDFSSMGGKGDGETKKKRGVEHTNNAQHTTTKGGDLTQEAVAKQKAEVQEQIGKAQKAKKVPDVEVKEVMSDYQLNSTNSYTKIHNDSVLEYGKGSVEAKLYYKVNHTIRSLWTFLLSHPSANAKAADKLYYATRAKDNLYGWLAPNAALNTDGAHTAKAFIRARDVMAHVNKTVAELLDKKNLNRMDNLLKLATLEGFLDSMGWKWDALGKAQFESGALADEAAKLIKDTGYEVGTLTKLDIEVLRNGDPALSSYRIKWEWDPKGEKKGTVVKGKEHFHAPDEADLIHLSEGWDNWVVRDGKSIKVRGKNDGLGYANFEGKDIMDDLNYKYDNQDENVADAFRAMVDPNFEGTLDVADANEKMLQQDIGIGTPTNTTKTSQASGRTYQEMPNDEFNTLIDNIDDVDELGRIEDAIHQEAGGPSTQGKILSDVDAVKAKRIADRKHVLENLRNEGNINVEAQARIVNTNELQIREAQTALQNIRQALEIRMADIEKMSPDVADKYLVDHAHLMDLETYANKVGETPYGKPIYHSDKHVDKVNAVLDLNTHEVIEEGVYAEASGYIEDVRALIKPVRVADLEFIASSYGMPFKYKLGRITKDQYSEQILTWLELRQRMMTWEKEASGDLVRHITKDGGMSDEVREWMIQTFKGLYPDAEDFIIPLQSVTDELVLMRYTEDLVAFYREGKVLANEFSILKSYRDRVVKAVRDGKQLSDDVIRATLRAEDALVDRFDQKALGLSLKHVDLDEQEEALSIFNKVFIPDHDLMSGARAIDAGYNLTEFSFTSPNEINNWLATSLESQQWLETSIAIVKEDDLYRIAVKNIDMKKAPWQMTTPEFLVWWTGSPKETLASWGLVHIPQELALPAYRTRLQIRINSLDDAKAMWSSNFTEDEIKLYGLLHSNRRKVLDTAIERGHDVDDNFLKAYDGLIQQQSVLRHQGFENGLPIIRVGRGKTRVQPTKEMQGLPFVEKYNKETGRAQLSYRTLDEFIAIWDFMEPVGTKGKKVLRTGWGEHLWQDDYIGLKTTKKRGEPIKITDTKALPRVIDLIASITDVIINYTPDYQMQSLINVRKNIRPKQRRVINVLTQLEDLKFQYAKESGTREIVEQAIDNVKQARDDIEKVMMLLDDRIEKNYPSNSSFQIDELRKKEGITRVMAGIGDMDPLQAKIQHGTGWSLAGGPTKQRGQLPMRSQIDEMRAYVRKQGEPVTAKYKDARTWALFELLNGTGLRISEVRDLRWSNIVELPNGNFAITIKQTDNRRGVQITLDEGAQNALAKLQERAQLGIGVPAVSEETLFDTHVFVRENGERYKNSSALTGHISDSGGETQWGLNAESIKKWKGKTPSDKFYDKTGSHLYIWRPDQELHAHDLRRNYAVKVFYNTGGDIAKAQNQLGHEGPITTVLYYLRRGGVPDNMLQDAIKDSKSGTVDKILKEFTEMVGTEEGTKVAKAAEKAMLAKQFAAINYHQIKMLQPINLKTAKNFGKIKERVKRNLEYFFTYDHAGQQATKAGENFKNKFKSIIRVILEDEQVANQFYEEVARRTQGSLNDIQMGQKLIHQAGLRRIDVMDMIPITLRDEPQDLAGMVQAEWIDPWYRVRDFGQQKGGMSTQDVLKEYLEELQGIADPSVGRKTVNYLESPNVDAISGWQLTDQSGKVVEFSPVYLTREAAEQDAYYYAMRKNIAPKMTVKEVELGSSAAWEDVLPNYYRNWRRSQWYHNKEEILQYEAYQDIVENYELWNRELPGKYAAGLKDFHPLINDDAPLGYRKFLADLKRRNMGLADLEANTPRYIKPTDKEAEALIQAGIEHSGYWNRQIQTGKSLGTKNNHPPVQMGLNPKYNKPRQYIVVGPRHAYEMIPEEDYIAYVVDAPKGVEEVIDESLQKQGIFARYFPQDNKIKYQSESMKYNPTIRNHEIGHALVHDMVGTIDINKTLSDQSLHPLFREYGEAWHGESHEPIRNFLDEDKAEAFWKDLELWLTDPDSLDKPDIVSVFKKHFGDVHKDLSPIRKQPAQYDPGIHGLNYEGVKVKYANKPYVLTNNTHYYPSEDWIAPLSDIGMWHDQPPIYGKKIILTRGRHQWGAHYAIVDLMQLKPQYQWVTSPIKTGVGKYSLELNPEVNPRFLRDFPIDVDASASSIRATAQNYVPEYGLSSELDALKGILIDTNGNVLNNHRDVLVHQYWDLPEVLLHNKKEQYNKELFQSLTARFGIDESELAKLQGQTRTMEHPVLVRMLNPLDEASMQDLIDRVNPRVIAPPDGSALKKIIEREAKLIESALDEGVLPGLKQDDEVIITFDDFISHLANKPDALGGRKFIKGNQYQVEPQFRESIWRTMAIVLFPEEQADFVLDMVDFRKLSPDERVHNLMDIITNEFGWLLKYKKDHPDLYSKYIAGKDGIGLLYDIEEASRILAATKYLMPDKDIRYGIKQILQPETVDGVMSPIRLIQDATQPDEIISKNAILLAEHTASHGRFAGSNLSILSKALKEEFDRQVRQRDPQLLQSLEDIIKNGIERAEKEIANQSVTQRTYAAGAADAAIVSTRNTQAVSDGLETVERTNRAKLAKYAEEIAKAKKLTAEQIQYMALMHRVMPDVLGEIDPDYIARTASNLSEIALGPEQVKARFGERTLGEVAVSWKHMADNIEDNVFVEWHRQILDIVNEYGPQKPVTEGSYDTIYYTKVKADGPWDKFALENADKADIVEAFAEWVDKGAKEAWIELSDMEKTMYHRAKEWLNRVQSESGLFSIPHQHQDGKAAPYEELIELWKHLDVYLLAHGYTGAPIAFGGKDAAQAVWRVTGAGDGSPMGFEYTTYGKELREKIIKMFIAKQQVGTVNASVPKWSQEILEGLADQIVDLVHLYNNGIINQAFGKARPKGGIRTRLAQADVGVRKAKDQHPTTISNQKHIADSIGMWLDMISKAPEYGGLGIPLGDENIWELLQIVSARDVFRTTKQEARETLVEKLNYYHYANLSDNINQITKTGQVPPSLKQLSEKKKLAAITGSKYADPEDTLKAINIQLRFAHSELWDAMSAKGIDEKLRLIGPNPMQIEDINTPVPQQLVDGLDNSVEWGLLSEEQAATWANEAIAWNGQGDTFAYHPNKNQNPLPHNEATEQELLYVKEEIEKALRQWHRDLVGPEGNLNQGIELPIEEEHEIREQLKSAWIQEGGLLDQYRAIKHTAIYGTKDTSQLSKVLMPEAPRSDLEQVVDAYVDRSLDEFKLGPDPYDMDLWQSRYGPGSDNWETSKNKMSETFQDLAERVDLEDQPAEVVMSQRFDKHVERVKQDPMKWMDWRTLRSTIDAQEGLASLEGAVSRLTPEELALLAPGYYNWGFGIPLVGDRVVLGATKPRKIHGATKLVGNAMVDYQTNTNLDQVMKTIFPFWIFPTRSIKFWLGELAAKPKILSTWSQIQGMSERMAHDVGATDTRGHQLPRFRGNINLTGTNWWWNPTAPLSFTQALPGARNIYGLADSEAPIFKRLATYLYAFGPATGFHLAPWISIPMHRMGWLDENEFPQRSLLGQADLIPEWHQRDILKKVQDSLWYSIRPDATWTPEVSWKDFLIERQVLINLNQEIEPMHELGKQEKVKEAEMAILLRTGERWSTARQELEQTDYFARIVGYLSGTYGKKFHKGEAALYEARDEVGRLRRQISLDANYEEFYKDYRYNTADGLTYGLYKDISWVTDEDGKQLYGQARWDEVSKNIAYQQQMAAKIAREGANRRMLEIRLSELPIGSPWEAKEEIYQDYEEIQKSILKSFPDVVYQWGPYNKNDETIREHVVDKWMKIVGEGRPFNWNREEQDWTQFQNSIVEWEDDIPNIGKLNIDRLFMELAGEKLLEPLKDYEGQPLYQKDEAGNVLLDAKGEPVPETIFESVLGKRIEVKKALLAMATSAEWNKWDIDGDSLDDALNRVWLDNYAGAFYDTIDAGGLNEAEGSEREQLERAWIEKYPGGPSTVDLTGWIRTIYGDKWSDEQIALHRYGSGVATREERSEMQATARQKAANEVYKWYGWVGPRGAKSEFYDTLEKIDERDGTEWTEVLGDFLDPSRKRTSSAQGLFTYWSDKFWTDFYNAMREVSLVLDLQAPTDEELEEWVLAEQLNDQFNRWRELDYGPNWDGLNALYYNKTRSEQLDWRKENPGLWQRLQDGWTMKDAWGEQHPAWQKFFDPDVYHGTETARSSISGYSGVGSTVTFGGENWRHSFAPSAALDSYKGVSISKIIQGLERPQTPGQWPTLEVSQLALEELLAGKVSDTTEEYLKKLHQRVASYSPYETFLKQLRDLARSVLGDITKEEDDWIWNREGASTDTVSPEMPVTPGGREDTFTPQRS